MKTQRARFVRQMVEQANLQVVDLMMTGSGHLAAIARAANGQQRKFFFSATPSDHRGDKNKLSMLRRFAAETACAH